MPRKQKACSHQDILIDDQDRHLLRWNWNVNKAGYYLARVEGTPSLLHRVIMSAAKGQCVDHINGNRLDNRRVNLRLCSPADNRRNRSPRKDSTAPYKGITYRGGKWIAQIQANKQYYRIGVFDTAEAAAIAYDKAALKLHGDFARTNFAGSCGGDRVIEPQASA